MARGSDEFPNDERRMNRMPVVCHSTFFIIPAIFLFMPAYNILVGVVDGLRASALGAYGNTTFPTPALDHFAADSFLHDWCYATSVELAEVYRALWQSGEKSLPRHLKSLGYATTLITDDPALPTYPAALDFDDCVQLDEKLHESVRSARATDTAHTSLAHLFATAAEAVASSAAQASRLVWLHSRGMYGLWDAPLDFQESLRDEGDPPPVEVVAPPNLVVSAADDPDAVFRFSSAYAAQAMVFDDCWQTLMDAVDSVGGAARWLATLIGARGFPLGEHGCVGGVDPRLYGEQLHVPWLIRFPDVAGRLARCQQLTSHSDFAASLLNASEGAQVRAMAPQSTRQDALIAASLAGHRAIRTAEWCLRSNAQASLQKSSCSPGEMPPTDVELFVRPDDRWEANDVAKLCPDVVESLLRRLRESG
jgi:arylsulfatase A-like enzyme